MRIGRGWIGGIVTSCALLVAVAGCGEPEAEAEKRRNPAPSPTASTTPTAEADGDLVPPGLTDDLADVPLPDLTVTPNGSPAARVPLHGADVSWPQCPKGMGIPQRKAHGAPMPTTAAGFVIIGLTNGPAFTPNPCLEAQVTWARNRGLMVAAYAVTSYPTPTGLRRYGGQGPYDGTTRLGALRNVGYQAALFNLRNLRSAGLPTPIVWVDVEPLTIFEWSDDPRANAAVVQGTVKGYTDAGYRVGFYSTPLLWQRIVGDLRLRLPEWRAAGPTSRAEALRRCRADWSFQGGRGIFGQWVEDDRDRNVTCPGAVMDARRWFGTF